MEHPIQILRIAAWTIGFWSPGNPHRSRICHRTDDQYLAGAGSHPDH